jgi:hypothetical protein
MLLLSSTSGLLSDALGRLDGTEILVAAHPQPEPGRGQRQDLHGHLANIRVPGARASLRHRPDIVVPGAGPTTTRLAARLPPRSSGNAARTVV